MTDRELLQQWMRPGALVPVDMNTVRILLDALRERLAQPEQREVEIEFKEWMHPQIGVVPVDPKTPLILKAHIRDIRARGDSNAP